MEEATPEVKKVPTSRTLTREMVLKGRPCSDYRYKFIERFPVSVEVTLDLALSQIGDWEWDWAAEHLLSRSAQREFYKREAVADKAYSVAVKPFNDLLDNAYTEYYKVRGAAMREADDKGLSNAERYDYAAEATKGILDVPRAATNAAIEAASGVYNEARVRIFVELFLTDAEAYTEEHKNDRPFVEGSLDDDDEYEDDWYSDDEENEDC
jgi:hypothetical protein